MPEFHNQIGTNYGTINQAGRDINQAGGDVNVSNVEALAAASELREALRPTTGISVMPSSP